MRRALLAIALVGCAKDAKEPPRVEPPPAVVIDAAAAVVAASPAVQLAPATAHTHDATSAAVVIIAADGAVSIGVAPAGGELAAIRGEPVAELGELKGRVAAIAKTRPLPGSPDASCQGIDGQSGGRYGTVGASSATGEDRPVPPPEPTPAGLRAAFLAGPRCARFEPLVLVDVAAPAARMLEVLSVFWNAQVGVTMDGGAHAAALELQFQFDEGNRPSDEVEIGFTLGATGITASGYKGPTAKRKGWTWRGDLTKLDEALREAREKPELRNEPVRIRVEPTTTAGELIAAVIELLDGGAGWIGFGEPVERLEPPRPVVKGPTANLGQITGDAALDKATVRRYLKRNLAKIKYCYEKQLLVDPKLAGTVTASFTIGADGLVTNAHAGGMDPTVDACIAGVLGPIEFPKPKGGAPVSVAGVPITFAPGAP